MNNYAKTIVFAGSYELGEKVSNLQKELVKNARLNNKYHDSLIFGLVN